MSSDALRTWSFPRICGVSCIQYKWWPRYTSTKHSQYTTRVSQQLNVTLTTIHLTS